MPHVITQIGAEPILLVKVSDPFDFYEELPAIRSELLRIFSDASKIFFAIYDIREITISFNDIMTVLAIAAYPLADESGLLQKYGRICIVGTGPLIALCVELADRFLAASGSTRAFSTPEEALAYAREQLARSG
jgi:hypothetical protein